MGFINLGRLNIRKRNSCANALVSLSDVSTPSVYKSHILNGPVYRLYLSAVQETIFHFTVEAVEVFVLKKILNKNFVNSIKQS